MKNKKMKNKRMIITVGTIIILALVVVLFSVQTDLMQGFMGKKDLRSIESKLAPKYYLHKGKIVSMLTSPVTSVVVSNVTSPVGTSKVASAVTSPVTSSVLADKKVSRGLKTKNLPTLKGVDLENESKKAYRENPAKFELPATEKKRIIDAFNAKNNLR